MLGGQGSDTRTEIKEEEPAWKTLSKGLARGEAGRVERGS